MNTPHFKSVVLFGGAGFIGSHFAAHLLDHNLADRVTLADLLPAKPELWPATLQQANHDRRAVFVQLDVRKPINHLELPTDCDLIVNLAAVHREPGHEPHEYFATNLGGAENVCAWAERIGCNRIIFTSSIAAYGSGDMPKDETTLPIPHKPYGVSKLVAEKIHIGWQRAAPGRRLLVVRPGLVYGAGENGNLSRMIKAILGRYFFYTGNRNIEKAGGYVKELCRAIMWMYQWQETHNEPITLFNFTLHPAPTVEAYVNGITRAAGVRRIIPNVPYAILLLASYVINGISIIFRIKQPINPTRIRKLLITNNIVPVVLQQTGYQYHYTLDQALADWKKDRPQEWSV